MQSCKQKQTDVIIQAKTDVIRVRYAMQTNLLLKTVWALFMITGARKG